jgi:superfamily II DNA helicase RecQ
MPNDSMPLPLPLPLPEALRPWLVINSEFYLIICHDTQCQQAISPESISQHLYRKHQVQLKSRQQLTEYLQQWQWQYDFQSVPLPLDGSLPQPILPILDGFQCRGCLYKTTNRSVMRQHCNTKHNQKRLKDDELFQAIQLQTWFRERRARYWAVDATCQSRDVNNSSGSGSGDAGAAIKAEIAEWMIKEEGPYQASTIATEIDPWLRYTGWEEVLAGSKHDLVTTVAFTATATADEPKLARLIQSWERILQRSLNTHATVSNYKDILKWWASPKNEVVNQRPFELPEKRSITRYSQTFTRLLCYVIRTAPESIDEETKTGVTFSKLQLTYVKTVQEAVAVAVADDNNELDTALMGLIISLLAQETSQMLLYESPVMHYLAIRGVNPQTKRFYSPFQYTPILAHMIWIIRLLMLEVAVSEKGWPELGLQSRKEIGAVAGAVAERIHQLRRAHLCEGSFSPASSILSQLARGQALNRVTPSESNVCWSDDRETVVYAGKGVAMAKVRTMCQALTIELHGLLHELLFHQSVPPVPLPQLVDSMGSAQQFQQKGYSFLDHPDNARWKVGWEFLWERMLQEKGGWRLVEEESSSGSGSGQLQWIDQRCKAYLDRERQFLLQLFVAMHITGGQPARSPEIGSVKVRNSITSNRNIFVVNGRVAVVTTYDKSLKRRGKTEYVFRCFPDQISQIIVQYLVYVLPFSRVIEKTKGDFLFADKQRPWIKDQLSVAVAVATTKHLGVRLTVAGWRHVAIATANEHLRKASRIWKQDQEEEGEAVEGESDGEVEQSLFEHILVRQSAHGKQTADLRYAIDGAFLNRLGPDLVSAYSQASRAWHAFLHLESKGAAVAVAVHRPASPLQRPAKRQKLEVSIAVQGLQRILGPNARPQSEGQAHALELVHTATPQTPQIIVLGTGSGKSLLFFSVAAMVSHQTVIVVVPFAALVDDLIARARGHQLTCEEWQWQRQWKLLPQLLIVSADRAVEDDFLHFAKGLELNKQLAHVFFDECHVAVTDTSYREKLRRLWQLRYLDCRFTCLTATLLTVLEPVLRASLLLEHAKIYRQSTMRPTTRYRVLDCYGKDLWEIAEPLIRRLPLPPASRGVIYVRSYAQGKSVAEEMDCPFYKATATDKQELLTEWASGSGGWMVATGALGTGIDIPGVVYIIHLGRPYGLTSFMQQAGRGGRAGEISDSIVILPSSSSGSGSDNGQFPAPRQELVNVYSVEAQDEAVLTEYLESHSCRRAVLAKHLDGHLEGTDCITTDSILCDWCEQSLQPEDTSGSGSGSGSQDESGAKAIHQALRLEVQRDEQLERFHQLLHAYCIYCQLMRGGEEYSHCHRDCPYAGNQKCDVQAYRQWRSRLKLAPRDQCFRCGLSQSVCTAIEDQRACTYAHLMLPGLFFLKQVGQLHGICQEVGFRGVEEEWQWRWMNTEGEGAFGRREINWIRVWRRVAEIYLEIEDNKCN